MIRVGIESPCEVLDLVTSGLFALVLFLVAVDRLMKIGSRLFRSRGKDKPTKSAVGPNGTMSLPVQVTCSNCHVRFTLPEPVPGEEDPWRMYCPGCGVVVRFPCDRLA